MNAKIKLFHTIPSKIKNSGTSEFGRGLCICLVKFAEHAESGPFMGIIRSAHLWHERLKEDDNALQKYGKDIQSDVVLFKNIYLRNRTYEEAISHLIQMWFNAASDHLYEIEVPEQWKDTRLGNLIKQLQNFGLRIGHEFHNELYTFDDIITVMDFVREIALEIDRFLGLQPDIGEC